MQRNTVGVLCRDEITIECVPCGGFDLFEHSQVRFSVGHDIDRVRAVLEKHTITRVQSLQRELLVAGGTEQTEEMIEYFGHEIPGRSGVESEAIALPATDAAAEIVARLE